MSTISTTVPYTALLEPGAYTSPLTITDTGVIRAVQGFNDAGVYSYIRTASITNYGSVYGANGIPGEYDRGGSGIVFEGGQIFNGGLIAGGNGYSSYTDKYGDSYNAGSGGIGVYADFRTVLTNTGEVLGGSGGGQFLGAGYGNNGGGIGVDLAGGGQVTNEGIISGGGGGFGEGQKALFGIFYYNSGVGGNGGVGVALAGTSTLTNSGQITGGYGGLGNATGGGGGQGVSQVSGTLTNTDGGVIAGGYGSFGTYHGGNGAAGVGMSHGTIINTDASIQGGGGGAATSGGIFYSDGSGGTGGAGVNLGQGSLANSDSAFIAGGAGGNDYGEVGYARIVGGNGGAGVSLGHGSLSNSSDSVILGGNGGDAIRSYGLLGVYGLGGAGGAGVELSGVGTVTNSGSIEGGAGGYGSTVGGAGGAGVYLADGGKLVNTGLVEGGNGGGGSVYSGYGGDGVFLNGGTLITSGTIAGGSGGTAGDAVQFGAADSSMVIDPGAVFQGAIGGFVIGDVIDVTNLTPSQVRGDLHGDTLSMGGSGTLTFTGIPTGDYFNFASYGAGGTQITLSTTPCYRRGTRILAERGEVPIESLKIGDRVMTSSGITRPIRWIGRRSYSGDAAWGDREVLPIRIGAGALGDGLPRRDLWVSPEHALFIEDMLIPASLLVNGASIVQEDAVDEVTYLHLEFDSHAVIYAEGAAAESFVDDESRAMFDNAAEYARLYPRAVREPAHFCAPRTEEGEALEAVRRQLAARAEIMPVLAALPRRQDPIASRA
jgi:Hint domain